MIAIQAFDAVDTDWGAVIADRQAAVSRHVTIAELPEGYFREQLLRYTISRQARVWVVAKSGRVRDWACYIGHPLIEEIKPDHRQNFLPYLELGVPLDTPEGVIRTGDKMSEEEATALFPEMAAVARKYRP